MYDYNRYLTSMKEFHNILGNIMSGGMFYVIEYYENFITFNV